MSLLNKQGQFLVYLVTCLITGLPYVGVVYGVNQSVQGRWEQHCNPWKGAYHHRLERAIREHGEVNFTVEVIDKADDRRMLGFKERFYISLYDAFKNGYNGSTGGRTMIPADRSSEHCRKISEALIARGIKPPSAKGRTHSEESLTKMRLAHLGKASPVGEENGQSKLTTAQVIQIRKRSVSETNTALAKEYGVFRTVVNALVAGRTWRHLPLLSEQEEATRQANILNRRRVAAFEARKALAQAA
jgi:group I intron endonuclease